jgi:MoaA/NifB/PqqE/SkfB family radical SAM enzyme
MTYTPKNRLLREAINLLFILLSHTRNERLFRLMYRLIAFLAEKLVTKDYYVEKIRWIRDMFDHDHPSLRVTKHILRGTNPHHRKTLIKTAIINQLLVGTNTRKSFSDTTEMPYPPGFFVISPSMKCNLSCYGCYAGSYDKTGELSFEEIDSTLTQAKEMGMYFCVVSGGEPFFHPRIFDIFKKHNDVVFHVFTNGTLIDEATCRRLVDVGNVIPAISIEGYEKETDDRRGRGHFNRIMKAMDLLRESKILFGFSATLTRTNAALLNSDEFIDAMISKGCVLGWYFMYVPIGLEPNVDLMLTPEQRGQQYERLTSLRATKPILLADFWHDGPLVGGCIAGGRKYFHINANGDVEPCVFCHYATHNIRNTPLKEAIFSPMFRSLCARLPLHENLLRPCTLVDDPKVGRDTIATFRPYFTHPGADIIFTDLADEMDDYAIRYATVADELWEKYFPDKTL